MPPSFRTCLIQPLALPREVVKLEHFPTAVSELWITEELVLLLDDLT